MRTISLVVRVVLVLLLTAIAIELHQIRRSIDDFAALVPRSAAHASAASDQAPPETPEERHKRLVREAREAQQHMREVMDAAREAARGDSSPTSGPSRR